MRRPAVVAACLLAGTAWGVDVTLDNNLEIGPHGRRTGSVGVTVAPVKSFSGTLALGRSVTTSPTRDSTGNLALGLWGEPKEGFTLSADYTAYTGAKAPLVEAFWPSPKGPPELGVLGDTDKRQHSGLYGIGAGFRAWRAVDEDGAPDEEAFFQSLTLNVGVAGGSHRMPLSWTDTGMPPARPLARKAAVRPAEASIAEKALTLGMTAALAANTVAVTYTRHRYTYPSDADERLVKFLYARVPDSVAGVVDGLAAWEVTGSFHEALPWWDLSLSASYGYTRLESVSDSDRIVTAELGWEPLKWLSLHGGSLWSNTQHRTDRFTLGGLSLYF